MKKLYKYTIFRLKIAKICEGIRYFSWINMDMLVSNEEILYLGSGLARVLKAFSKENPDYVRIHLSWMYYCSNFLGLRQIRSCQNSYVTFSILKKLGRIE